MNLIKIICKTQYQVAKIEVIESLIKNSNPDQSTLEIQLAYNMINTLRKKLFDDTENCLELIIQNKSKDRISTFMASLQCTIISVNNLLLQMNSGINTTDGLWIKTLFTDIVSELMQLNSELDKKLTTLPRDFDIHNTSQGKLETFTSKACSIASVNDKVAPDKRNTTLQKLVSKCMGDYKQAERLIEYEMKKNKIDREEAIIYALIRWERDNL
jgi:hypothetical protein